MAAAKTVEEMMEDLPKGERLMVEKLRVLIRECIPKAIEKPYYGVGAPFYSHNRMICFIWPPSVFWGPRQTNSSQKKKRFSLGFCQGNLMSNEDGLLKSEGRKQVYILYVDSLSDLDEALIRTLLFEASLVDDSFGPKKTKRKR